MGLLAATLTQLPATAVNRQEARHLVDYLTNPSCLGASETLVQSADGLSALAKLPVFGQGDTTQVCRACVISSRSLEVASWAYKVLFT